MVCYAPQIAFEHKDKNPNGRRRTTFVTKNAREGYNKRLKRIGYVERILPCRRCVGCRLDYSRQWAIRCILEQQMHESASFVTLTYNDTYVPPIKNNNGDIIGYGDTNWTDFTLFLKRLRKSLDDKRIRYYACNEYGAKFMRPHFHALIFGHDFRTDRYPVSSGDQLLYRSPSLERLWTNGYSSVGDMTYQSAAYVSRYMMKKAYKDENSARYVYANPETGELGELVPESARMSRRPGLAKSWYDAYAELNSMHDKDWIVLPNGRKCRPPKYFDRLLEKLDVNAYEKLKKQRQVELDKFYGNIDFDGLARRSKAKTLQIRRLVRKL